MQDFPSPPDSLSVSALDLDVLMTRVRAEVEVRKRQASADVMLSTSGAVVVANRNALRTVGALLALPDAEFIRESYKAVFGRHPEELELTQLRDRLLTGQVTRSHALRDLLKTEEARRRKSKIVGLRQSLARDRFQRSLPGRWLAQVGLMIRTVYLLPRRIRQFLKRVDAIERMAAEVGLKLDVLDQKLSGVKAVAETKSSAVERTAFDALEGVRLLAHELIGAKETADTSAGWAERRVDEAVRKANALEQDIIAALEAIRAREDAVERAIDELRGKLRERGE